MMNKWVLGCNMGSQFSKSFTINAIGNPKPELTALVSMARKGLFWKKLPV